MIQLIKAIFWGEEIPAVDESVFHQMKIHRLVGLSAPVFLRLTMPDDLRQTWRSEILKQVFMYQGYLHEQAQLPISVPYVILKGTSAAKYYPHPEYRAIGDIDLMTRREDYETACEEMLQNGYTESTLSEDDGDFGRHRSFIRNGITVEIHLFFALLNDALRAKYLDDFILEGINDTHILPDMTNGLVLLEHIAQHMESGLGLRQIIDWMMFVDKCLPDEKWKEFQTIAKQTGFEAFAIITTRMCELFLGLPKRKWCAGADVKMCKQLLDYIMTFGTDENIHIDDEGIAENVFAYARTPIGVLKLLQGRGLANWKAARKYRILRPFAWIYQAGRYTIRGLKRKNGVSKFREEYKRAKERRKLFDALGVQQALKGLARYEDGEYVIRNRLP